MEKKVSLWEPGDWNGFFGLGTNVLVNLLVLTGLLKFVIQIPDAVLFGTILPAIGLMLFLGLAKPPMMTLSYLIVAALFYIFDKMEPIEDEVEATD